MYAALGECYVCTAVGQLVHLQLSNQTESVYLCGAHERYAKYVTKDLQRRRES